MPDVVIENPVINSPFDELRRHFYFSDDGITDKIVESRRLSSYFVPIPPSRKRSGKEQLVLETEWTRDRRQGNKFINDIRNAVAKWRFGNYDDITNTTRTLLEYWKRPDRERRLFFCQIEALETAIYFAELSDRRDAWIREDLRTANATANPLLNRVAFKMATGSGKTVVMAMIVAWHTLNKLADPKSTRFADSFLIVTPLASPFATVSAFSTPTNRATTTARSTSCPKKCAANWKKPRSSSPISTLFKRAKKATPPATPRNSLTPPAPSPARRRGRSGLVVDLFEFKPPVPRSPKPVKSRSR
jgi:hypothetical protein